MPALEDAVGTSAPAHAAEANYALVVGVAYPRERRDSGDDHRDTHQHAERQNDDMLVSVRLEYIDSSEYQPNDTGDSAAGVNTTQMLKSNRLSLGRMAYEGVLGGRTWRMDVHISRKRSGVH